MPRLIVNDDNWRSTTRLRWWRRQRGRGLRPWQTHPEAGRWRQQDPGPQGPAEWLPEDLRSRDALPLIPMEEWPDRIADLERRQATAYHVWRDSAIGALDQKSFGWCHAYSPTGAVRILRVAQGLADLPLSAASVAGPVTGFRNQGAWIMDDLRQIAEHGIATRDYVPEFCLSRRQWQPGAEDNALRHRVREWEAHRGRHFQKQMSWLLAGLPVCVGLHYWSHAVTDLRAVDHDASLPATDWRRYRVGSLNSWGPGYGDGGYFEREGSKAVADEMYAPRAIESAAAPSSAAAHAAAA